MLSCKGGAMSLRYEQYRALKSSRDFLRDILQGNVTWKRKDLKDQAARCLRHYPFLDDSGQPIFSNAEFTTDK